MINHTRTLKPQTLCLILLVLTLTVTFVPWLGDTLFNTKGEPREALVALSMVNTGDYILPATYGTDIPYKPPLLAWLIAACSWLTGGVVTEFSSRLPSVLATFLMVIGGYRFFLKRSDGDYVTSLATAIVTITTVEVYRAATACRVDMVLTACTVTAIYALESASRLNSRRRIVNIPAIVLMTCAVLTKGPVGMILPCLVTGIYLLIRGRRFWPTFGIMTLNGLLSLVIPAIWYYGAWLHGGERFLRLAMEENFGRFTGTMSYDSHLNPWWYNLVTLVAGMSPYTLLALMALFVAPWRRLKGSLKGLWSRIRGLDDATLLSLTASTVIFIFYCIPASKRSVYLLPMYPFLSYFIVRLGQWLIARRSRVVAIYALIIASLGEIVSWAVWGFHIVGPAGAEDHLKGALADMVDGLYNESFGISDWGLLITAIVVCGVTLAMTKRVSASKKAAGALCSTLAIYWVLGATLLPRTLNPKSDIVIAREVERLDPGVSHTYTYNSVSMMRYFTAGFYLGDRLRMFAPEQGSSQSVDGAASQPLPESGYLIVGERELPSWQELYGNDYTAETIWKGSRRSSDTRSVPLIMRFSRRHQSAAGVDSHDF